MNAIPDNVTIGDKYNPAMDVQTVEEAQAYFELCVEHTMRVNPDVDREEAEGIERSNLGYYAGYFGSEAQARVNRLFNTQHPIFGANTNPTVEDAIEAGFREAKKHK